MDQSKSKKSITSGFDLDLDWRNGAHRRSVLALNEVLWETGRFSDVTFLVGPEQMPIRAHRLMLTLRSPVFETMFSSSWSQQRSSSSRSGNQDTENTSLVVEVPDAQPDCFRAFLKFLYTDNTDEFVSPVDVLYLGQKYHVIELVSVCVAFLLQFIEPHTVVEIHQAAKLFELEELQAATLNFMLKNGESMVTQEDFGKLDLSTVAELLASDALNLHEVSAFQGLVKWARAECERRGLDETGENLRGVAESLIPLIRFPTMTPQDFANAVVPTNILTSAEIIKIFVYFNSHELSVCRNPEVCLPFITTPRTCNVKEVNDPKHALCSVGIYLSSEPCSPISLAYTVTGNLGKIHEEALDFTVDRDIEIIGVGLYGPAPDRLRNKNMIKTYMVDIQLFNYHQNGTGTSLKRALVSRTSQSVDTRNDYEVHFSRPIDVTKNTLHHVRIAFRGQETQHGVSRLSNVSALCNGNEPVIFNFLGPVPIATNQHQGRIRSLIFKPI